MPINVSQSTGGDFEIVPEGVYTARCIKIIDLGTQETEWQGQKKQQPKIMVTWEILDDEVKMQDGRPFAISTQYTASLSEKSRLYKDLVSWRGKAFTNEELASFDLEKLLGAYCAMQIIHTQVGEKTYANISTIMSTKDRPEGVNPIVSFDLQKPDMEVFNSFSEYLKDKIRKAPEWIGETQVDQNTEEKPAKKDIDLGNNGMTQEEIDQIPF